jgi:DNA polymerase III sliding clamp (beta) subunit (PCNA family)
MVLVKGEKFPLIKLTFRPDSVAIVMDVPEVGLMEDEIDAGGGPAKDFPIWFTPQNLLGAVAASEKEELELSYGPTDMKSLVIRDAADYRCDVMPRKVNSPGSGKP